MSYHEFWIILMYHLHSRLTNCHLEAVPNNWECQLLLAWKLTPNLLRVYLKGKMNPIRTILGCWLVNSFFRYHTNLCRVHSRVDMSKALHLIYTLHPKTPTNPLLTYSLTKPLTLTRLIEKFRPITNSPCFFHAWKFYKCFSK